MSTTEHDMLVVRVAALEQALRRLHDECCTIKHQSRLDLGPMIAPSEGAVLNARKLLEPTSVAPKPSRKLTTPEYDAAVTDKADRWVPACGGQEQPFACKGFRLLYCFNPAQGRHAYIDLDRDVELTDVEAAEIMS